MKVIICGSRGFTNYKLLKRKMNLYTLALGEVEVVSGGAEGADKLGERWACENYHKFHVFRPDYAKHGKKAPLVRNQEMVDFADALVAFWDGHSPGTRDVIDRAKAKRLKLRIVYYEEH